MKFELLAGKHSQGGKVYKPGEIVESGTDLCERFGAHRFKQVADPLVLGLPEEPPANGNGKKKVKIKREVETRGDDATSNYPLAEEHGLRVFKREKLYHVYDGDEQRPLNKSGLKKSQVEEFIVSYLDK